MKSWANCAVSNCEYKVCLGASQDYCYRHTIIFLLNTQSSAIVNEKFAKYIAVKWQSRYNDNNLRLYELKDLENELLFLSENEINYIGVEWKESAIEIINIIESKRLNSAETLSE